MTPDASASPLVDLKKMLSASREHYDACINHVEHEYVCQGVTAAMRLHHLKFDANGQPKLDAIARCLVEHAIDYAISARNRPTTMSAQQAARQMQAARKLFRVVAAPEGSADLAGEAGELLLYFLLETVLQAPQVVAKVELKTNASVEVNGSDGIHMRWHERDGVVDIYFGESKMYTDVGKALSKAFESIEKFHKNNMRYHEFAMVTKYFKGVDDNVKSAVSEILDTGKPGPGARVNHACLIGYDWDAMGITPGQAAEVVEAEYRKQFLLAAPGLHQMLQSRLNGCGIKQYRFEVFFLPVTSVQAFRDAFRDAME